jgi:Flp pilus assembly protein CpaB
MDVSNPRSRIGGSRTGQLLSSRRGALIIAIVAALAAGALFYGFAQNYKSSSAPVVPANAYVFVAQKFIPQGTPAQVIASGALLKRVQVSGHQVVAGAIPDPSAITGEVATSSIAAGQQITVADFTHASISISSYLSGNQRGISVPLDPAHGITAYLAQGDTVDIMRTTASGTALVAQNITVLANANGDVVLRVSDKQALVMANSSDDSKIWLTLRPPAQAQQSITVGSSVTAPR